MAGEVQRMPGAIDDKDINELYYNPFETLQSLQDEWRRKEHEAPRSTDKMSEVDLGDVDWHKYNPPSMLRKAPNVSSQILLEIISSSIENVKTRITEQDRQHQQEQERRKAAEDEAASKGKSAEPYLPIIIPPSRPPTPPKIEPDICLLPDLSHSSLNNGKAILLTSSRDDRPRRFALRRLFHRNPERGESSAAGGTRELLRQKLEARLSKVDIDSTDAKTQETILALRESGFINPSSQSQPEKEVECVSCLDDIPVKDTIQVPCHSYCKDCFIRLVTAAVQNEQQWPPKCCLNQIPFRVIVKHIPDELKTTFQERASEWELPVSERVYCSNPECAVWIQPKKINLAKRQAKCERGHVTCTICRGRAHSSDDCPQDYDMNLTNILAEEEGWKRCSNCHALVEHKEACQHMTCRCGHEFCYVCGQRWRTCQCSMQQLYALKEAVDNRREQRRFKEQVEAEELRAILAQIEEFERQEAERAELERLEQLRLEEERWQQIIKERIRQENFRRQEVEIKYQQLLTSLNDMHELQHVLVDMEQEENAKDLMKESNVKKRQLAEKHEVERGELETRHATKLTQLESELNKEYSTRVAQERKVEQEYFQQLQEFWGHKASGEEEIERAMFPLRKRMDQGHRAWKKWKEEQLKTCRSKMDDERTVREELMYSQRERMKDAYENQETELTRRMVAEKKWVQEVILERESLLLQYEEQEMEGDADSLFGQEVGDSA